MPLIRANANNGAVIAMIASDTNSFVVMAFFMRSWLATDVSGSSPNVVAYYKAYATRRICVAL